MSIASHPVRRLARACTVGLVLAAAPAIALAAPDARSASQSVSKPSAAPVPAGFKATSITWTSRATGWVLGAELCGKGNCAHSQVVSTTNGGKTWHLAGTIKAPIPKLGLGTAGITEIRFGSAKVGWAFAPGLFRTADGGKTWKSMPIPGGGKQVLDLAVTPAAAYAIASPCGYQQGICHGALTAWRTSLTSTSWTRMKLPRPLHVNVTASVAADGDAVYLVNPSLDGPKPTQIFASKDGGAHFFARPNPCTEAELHTAIQAIPYSSTKVAIFCDGNPGFSKAVKAVYVSRDTGKTDKYAGTMSVWGIQAQLAVSPSGNLLVAAWSDGSFIDINDTHGTKWYQIIGSGDGGAGMNDPTYVSDNEAWVVYGPASMFADYGELLKSTDSGRHWTQFKF